MTTDIEFDDTAADKLSSTANHVADTLTGQAGGRSGAIEAALKNFSGGYVLPFIAVCNAERDGRAKLAGVLSDLSIKVGEAKALAAKERARIKALAEWTTREKSRDEQRSLNPFDTTHLLMGASDPKPSDDAISPPTISAAFDPVHRARVPGFKHWGEKVSADPASLRAFSTTSRGLNSALDPELVALSNAWAAFTGACSWVEFGNTSFIGGYTRFIGENQADATWIENIAAAFEKAGTGTMSVTRLILEVGIAASNDPKLKSLMSGKLSPEEVATAWQELMDDPSGKYNSHELLLTYADILGELDGIPALARVEANRNRVPALVGLSEADLAAERKKEKPDPERIAYLEHEASYLKEVASGNVQLYLYDRNDSRIIEMIGTPGPDTKRAITYIPGTFTGMDSFFSGGVQSVSKYLEGSVDGTVAFVYKDGKFPGEKPGQAGEPDYTRILEANNQEDGIAAGKQLASFETGMRTDPALTGAQQIGIGHSWGVANLTSSEVAGAHYDKVISLAGAGMPEGWKPDEKTVYTNMNYYDILIHAQHKVSVWGGNNPGSSSDFKQYYYADDRIKGNFINEGGEFDALIDNHNRITRDSPDNRELLKDMRKVVTQ